MNTYTMHLLCQPVEYLHRAPVGIIKGEGAKKLFLKLKAK